jgi:hypothetical protein
MGVSWPVEKAFAQAAVISFKTGGLNGGDLNSRC